ncbi:hypothetical protein GCM10022253_13820 [Sphingomonas endophytica]|uniref:Transposase n=1 Tax=Sphingomonas endophytica TaxID=869719 RepID=A0ABR6N4Z2_9SPHN|nr:hypothetical protein [Sphingomonas endophytica]
MTTTVAEQHIAHHHPAFQREEIGATFILPHECHTAAKRAFPLDKPRQHAALNRGKRQKITDPIGETKRWHAMLILKFFGSLRGRGHALH